MRQLDLVCHGETVHAENARWMHFRMVCEQPSRKDVSRIFCDQTCIRSMIEVRICCFRLLKTKVCSFRHQVHVEIPDRIRSHIVPVCKKFQVKRSTISSNVQVVSGVGRIGFNKVVWFNGAWSVPDGISVKTSLDLAGRSYPQVQTHSLADFPLSPLVPQLRTQESGLRDKVFPTKTVPMIASTPPRSNPIP